MSEETETKDPMSALLEANRILTEEVISLKHEVKELREFIEIKLRAGKF